MKNLHRDKNSRRALGRDGKALSYHRQDDNVAIGGISNMGRWDPSAVSEIQTKNKQEYIQSTCWCYGLCPPPIR